MQYLNICHEVRLIYLVMGKTRPNVILFLNGDMIYTKSELFRHYYAEQIMGSGYGPEENG